MTIGNLKNDPYTRYMSQLKQDNPEMYEKVKDGVRS